MTVEELRVCALAHGVQPKQDFLKKILRVELMRFGMIVFELIFDPVSYTHLDVYKRQVYSGRTAWRVPQ